MNYCTLLSQYLVIMTNKKTPKTPKEFVCVKCDFKCFKSSDYERHLNTAKHKIRINPNKNPNTTYDCICGKNYKHLTSLCNHKKKCNYKTPEEVLKDEMKEILEKQNEEQRRRDEEQRKRYEEQRIRDEEQKEEQKRLIEEHKQQIEVLSDKISGMSLVTNHNTINNTTNNNTTNTFNLKFFLNTQCKDAIDFNSFLRSIKVDNEDLDMFDNNGYIAGMMNVLERNLYSMKIEDRPIHCTDKKRKTIYYKKENGDWEKDGDKVKMPYLIDHIENVSNNYFEKIYRESGGLGDNDTESLRYKWYIKMTFATTGGDYESSKVNHTRIMGLLTDEIYVKVVKTDKIRS